MSKLLDKQDYEDIHIYHWVFFFYLGVFKSLFLFHLLSFTTDALIHVNYRYYQSIITPGVHSVLH